MHHLKHAPGIPTPTRRLLSSTWAWAVSRAGETGSLSPGHSAVPVGQHGTQYF